MKALIDADVLLYEIGFSSERSELVGGHKVVVPASWEFCQELFDKKITLIQDEIQATEPPRLFFTNTASLNKTLNKRRAYIDEAPVPFVDNFRYALAKERAYKAGRASAKPFHFNNIIAYALSEYDCHVNESGLEADDAMCIEQYSRWKVGDLTTTICSRDKDLRQCPGWHYSWECGKQASIGPMLVDELGILEEREKGVFGTGDKFFYYQLVVGDAVDTVGGLYNKGPKFAYPLLKDATSSREAYEAVAEVYVRAWGERWKEKIKEQADLLWMVRETKNGKKVLWKPPKLLKE